MRKEETIATWMLVFAIALIVSVPAMSWHLEKKTRNIGKTQPIESITPGSVCTTTDKDFKMLRYPEQIAICNRNVSKEEKEQVARLYGIDKKDWHNYE